MVSNRRNRTVVSTTPREFHPCSFKAALPNACDAFNARTMAIREYRPACTSSPAKRAAVPGSKALIIDDFMRGGGRIKGIAEILSEVDIEVAGVGVAIVNVEPRNKKVSDYVPIVYLGTVDEYDRTVEVTTNFQIF